MRFNGPKLFRCTVFKNHYDDSLEFAISISRTNHMENNNSINELAKYVIVLKTNITIQKTIDAFQIVEYKLTHSNDGLY